MDLTVAETELLRIFDASSRRRCIADMIGTVTELGDALFEIAVPALEKLSHMSDADFYDISASPLLKY
jgi:hypothetical protein